MASNSNGRGSNGGPPWSEGSGESPPEGAGAETPAGPRTIGEHCYVPTALVAFLVGESARQAASTPTMTLWWDPARARWCAVLHARQGSCSAFHCAADLPALFMELSNRLRGERLRWRADRRGPLP